MEIGIGENELVQCRGTGLCTYIITPRIGLGAGKHGVSSAQCSDFQEALYFSVAGKRRE